MIGVHMSNPNLSARNLLRALVVLAVSISTRAADAQILQEGNNSGYESVKSTDALNFESSSLGPANSTFDLFPFMPAREDRAKSTCRLTATGTTVQLDSNAAQEADKLAHNQNCSTLLKAAAPGAVLGLSSTSTPDKYAVISFAARKPEGFAKPAATISPAPAGTYPSELVWPAKLPKDLRSIGSCVAYAERWLKMACDPSSKAVNGATDQEKHAVELAVAARRPVTIFVHAIDATSGEVGAWLAFDLSVSALAQTQGQAPGDDLGAACREKMDEDRRNNITPLGDAYAVCVDLIDSGRPRSVTIFREAIPPKAREVVGSRDKYSFAPDNKLYVRRPIVVYVWHPAELRAAISMEGTEGFASTLYVPKGSPFAAGVAAQPTTLGGFSRVAFMPRTGASASLSVALKNGTDEKATFKQNFVVENLYRSTLRMGIGLAWSPFARQVDVQTEANGQKVSAITSGSSLGILNVELVIGYSYFFCDMPDTGNKICFAFGAGLGILKDGSTGIKALSSFRVGPELAVGTDFSIALTYGIHRFDKPRTGYEPGSPLAPGTSSILTETAFTTGFGLVLNYSPSFFKAAGIVAGGS